MKEIKKAIKVIDLIKEMDGKPELKFIWGGFHDGYP